MTPWDIDVLDAMREHSLLQGEARDLVILDWLARGDAKPFYDLVFCGHQPSQRVLKALGFMLMRGDPDCSFDPAKTSDPVLAAAVPFALVVKGDKAGRKGNAYRKTRDRQIAKAVEARMAEGWTYEGAILAAHEWLKSIDISVSVQTVRDAYDSQPKR